MTQTTELLQKIAALRLRLDQAQGLAREVIDSGAAAATGAVRDAATLAGKVAAGNWHHALLDGALRQLEKSGEVTLPTRLTHRAARALKTAHDLLQELKALAEDPLLADHDDALADLHKGSTAMLDAVMRTLQALPASATEQMRTCDGLDAVLGVVAERQNSIKAAVRRRSVQADRIDRLADCLRRIAAGQLASAAALQHLAAEVHDEAKQGTPQQFLTAAWDDAPRHVAAHSLNVAQVLARVMLGDAAWLGRELDGITAALVHDVGMLALPAEILTQTTSLTEPQRRLVERHPLVGAQALVALWPGGGWPIDAAADHHERSDGVGYPRGKRDLMLSDDVKLLAVCDVYAALATPRAHRPALEPRTALADTLMLADEGKLDRRMAERLLALSFYPAGSAVQLDDGALALVLAPQTGAKALTHPARPTVLVVLEPHQQAPALPRLVDLSIQAERSIVRSVTAAERRRIIGPLYPELA